MVSLNVLSDKLLLMIKSSHEKLQRLFQFPRVGFGIQDQEIIIKPYF